MSDEQAILNLAILWRPALPSQTGSLPAGVGNLISAPRFPARPGQGATVFLDLGTLEPHKE